jgi:hypothetical protein
MLIIQYRLFVLDDADETMDEGGLQWWGCNNAKEEWRCGVCMHACALGVLRML